MKTKVALFFGGASNEYEVSLRSAAAVLRAFDEERYEIYKIGLDRDGRWLLTEATPDLIAADAWQGGASPCLLSPDRALRGLWVFRPGEAVRRILPDVLFPLLHGRLGEDGCLQGLFALSGIPYVGCPTEAGALGMDKDACKRLAQSRGIPVVPWVRLSGTLLADPERARAVAEEKLAYPMFLKPARSGSSVGAGRVECPLDFPAALRAAGREDDCVLVEACVPARELEVAVLEKPSGELEISRVGEVLPPGGRFYSYREKYEADSHTRLSTHAGLLPSEENRLRAYAGELFSLLGCRSCARVDFFLSRETGRVYFNEINTMPGFTEISMYPRLLCKERSMSELLDELMAGAHL